MARAKKKAPEPTYKHRVRDVSVPVQRVVYIDDGKGGKQGIMHMKMHVGEGTFTDGTKFTAGHIIGGGISVLVEDGGVLGNGGGKFTEYTIELMDVLKAVERAHIDKLPHEED